MSNEASNVIAFGGNTMVYESIKRFALRELHDLIRVLMENVDDALFDLSEKAGSDQVRTRYFDAMRLVRLKRKAIEEGFDVAMQQSFDNLMLERSPLPQKQDDGELELSLVDHEELEDKLAIDNMVSRARPQFEDELFAIRERLRTVLHRKQVPADLNPFDPLAICDSFHQACQVLDTEIEVKLILYKLFDRFVMRSLDGFYDRINGYFVDKGVLPELHAARERLNQGARKAQQQTRGASAGPGLDELAAATADGNILGLLQQALMPGAAPAGAAPAAGMPGTAPAAGAGATNLAGGASAGMQPAFFTALQGLQTATVIDAPVEQVDPGEMKAHMQQQMVAFREQNRHQVSAADDQIIDIVSMLFDFFFEDKALPDPVKVLIGRLQIPILKVAILDKGFFNSKKHPARKLLDSISKASLGWSEDAVEERVLIAEIERIVDFLIAEFDQDVSVFEQALSEFEAFREQEKRRAEEEQDEIERIEREREQRLQKARQAADRLIGEVIGDKELGFDVVDFLQGTWHQVLVYTWMAKGEDSNHWKNLRRITATLVWTLIPKDTEEERQKLLDTLRPLLTALTKGMELIDVRPEQRNRVFQMMVLEHAKVVKQTSRNISTRPAPVEATVLAPDAEADSLAAQDHDDESIDILIDGDADGGPDFSERPEDAMEAIGHSDTQTVIRDLEDFTSCVQQGEIEVDEEIVIASEPEIVVDEQQPEIDREVLEQVQSLQVGDWIEFLQDDGQWQHARLSWKSNVTGKLVFVNRHGRKLRDTRVKHLAGEFAAGRARPLESVSVFDRAIHSIMSGLRS